MDCDIEVKNLRELLQPLLGANKDILKVTTKKFNTLGENYGGQILLVDVDIRHKEANKEETVHLIAKMCPPNEWLRALFCISDGFDKETAFYNTILPALRAFQREQGVESALDCFPECYGARVSLDPESRTVDDDAVVLLQNLNFSGYQNAGRLKVYELDAAEVIMKEIAALHAVTVALKLTKPVLFREKILPHLYRTRIYDSFTDDLLRTQFDVVLNLAKQKEESRPFVSEIDRSLKTALKNFKTASPRREPFATISHNDIWANNVMIKYENGKPVKAKIFDFQQMDYGSPGNDIIFFLFSSVKKSVLDKHYDDLILLYYTTFIDTLKQLKCDPVPFTFELLKEEINTAAKETQIGHVLVALKFMLTDSKTSVELGEMNIENLLLTDYVSDAYKERIPEIIIEFVKRKWI